MSLSLDCSLTLVRPDSSRAAVRCTLIPDLVSRGQVCTPQWHRIGDGDVFQLVGLLVSSLLTNDHRVSAGHLKVVQCHGPIVPMGRGGREDGMLTSVRLEGANH